jgi:peroxiredoxin
MSLRYFAATFEFLGFLLILLVASTVNAVQNFEYTPITAENTYVPQYLLPLAHATEVQQELGVDDKRQLFEDGLRILDQVWWPSRNLPLQQQRALVAKLEPKLLELVETCCGKSAVSRLQQLELQAQAVRSLARADVINFLQLTSEQTKRLTQVFEATEKLAAAIDPRRPDNKLQTELQTARKQELAEAQSILTTEQLQSVKKLFGKETDTSKFQRIFAMAPKFFDTSTAIGNGQFDWSNLKGKVVLVHFYAFECHNCHANFPIYKRWSDQLASKGVEVIGIQTPETSNESDLGKIVQAAKRDGFKFPVIADLKKQNWDAWGNTMWPTVYVVDKNGYIRSWWQGELRFQGASGDEQIEKLVRQLLEEKS